MDIGKKISKRVKKDKVKQLEKYSKQLENQLIMKEKELEAALVLKDINHDYEIKSTKNGGKLTATAFIVFSDWHIDEIVNPKTVNYLNEFNLDIADLRINCAINNSIRLLRITEKDVKLDKVVICLLGDFVSGSIHEELLANTSLRPLEAIMWVTERLHAGIKTIKDLYPDLLVVCCYGNHSRISAKIFHSVESGMSMEFMMYHMLKQMSPEIDFQVADGYHSYIGVYDKVIRMSHGHAIRYFGGIGNIFPSAYKAISQWNKSKRADLDIWGHLHSTKCGQIFMQNGSLIGYNAYALKGKFDFEVPVQKFFLYLSNGMISMDSPIILDKI